MGRMHLAQLLWLQGFPDQAMRATEQSIDEAQATNHAVSLCWVLAMAACPIAVWTGDLATAEQYGDMLLAHSAKHELSFWRDWARRHQGVLAIKHGDIINGLALLRDGFAESGYAVSTLRITLFRGVMAEALGRDGQIADGLTAIDDALARIEKTEGRWLIAELLRIKGELLVLQGAQVAGAEDHFRQALDWARRQGALSWELRAATSLARLLRNQGRSADAKALLQPVYDRFTEGFDTADLKAAKALLDELAADSASGRLQAS
jgi:predicted ATPase